MGGFNKRLFGISLLVLAAGVCLYRFPSDDGLRHVGMAFADFKSWGEVYPYSVFERFKDYDPWLGYDVCLRVIASGLKRLPLPQPVTKFLLIKGLSFLFLCTFLWLVSARSGMPEAINDRLGFSVAFVILFALLVLPFLRITIIRPFAFGSFFLIYAAGQKGICRGALSSALLMCLYPYMSWFYTIPAALAHFLKGNKRFALGVAAVTLLFLWSQPASFWGFQIALFKSDMVRGAIAQKIGEFGCTLNQITFYMFVLAFLLLFPLLPKNVKRLNYPNLLLLIYLVPSLRYIRYFIDLTLPLFFISFSKPALEVLRAPCSKFALYWREALKAGIQKLKHRAGAGKRPRASRRAANIKPYIALVYGLILALLIHHNFEKFDSLKKFQAQLAGIPPRALVLSDFSLQYKTLYSRSDLRLIPSCEMGFPEEIIKKEYLGFINDGEISPLARKTGAAFLLENEAMYINPLEGGCMKLEKAGDEVNIWRLSRPAKG